MVAEGSIFWISEILLKNGFQLTVLMIAVSLITFFAFLVKYGRQNKKEYLRFTVTISLSQIFALSLSFLYLYRTFKWEMFPASDEMLVLLKNVGFFLFLNSFPHFGLIFSSIILLFLIPKLRPGVIELRMVSFSDASKYVILSTILISSLNFLYIKFLNPSYQNNDVMIASTCSLGVRYIYFSWLIIAVPLVEEIFFRGIFQAQLMSLFSKNFSIIVIAQAIFFSAAHFDFLNFPLFFLNGLVYGFVFQKSKTVIPCCLIHVLQNIFAIATTIY